MGCTVETKALQRNIYNSDMENLANRGTNRVTRRQQADVKVLEASRSPTTVFAIAGEIPWDRSESAREEWGGGAQGFETISSFPEDEGSLVHAISRYSFAHAKLLSS